MEYQKDKFLKTSISLSPMIMQKVDNYASELGLSRSATIAVLVNQAFDYQEQVKQVAEFNKNYQQFSDDMKKAIGGLSKLGKTK